MEELLSKVIENVFDELDSAWLYYKLAVMAKDSGNMELAHSAISTASDELEHFKWQHEYLEKLTKDRPMESTYLKAVHHRNHNRYQTIKTNIDGFSTKH